MKDYCPQKTPQTQQHPQRETALTSMTALLRHAQDHGYAVPAFNIHNMETLSVVVETALELRSPVILAATPSTVTYMGQDMLLAMARAAAIPQTQAGTKAPLPIALHLDHATDPKTILHLLEMGYPSAMIDGSHGSFEENVEITKGVVTAARALSPTISIEAELGRLGGQEDDLMVDEADSFYTDPLAAKAFVEQTKIDCLAVAIGTAHGLYHKAPKIDLARLSAIRQVVSIPLVLHGASGLSEDLVRECIARGICKVNIATELKIAFKKGLTHYLNQHPQEEDPRRYFQSAREEMKKVVTKKIQMCMSQGRA